MRSRPPAPPEVGDLARTLDDGPAPEMRLGKASDITQVPIRMHVADYMKVKELLKADRFSWKEFVCGVLMGYMERNPEIKRLVERYIEDYRRKVPDMTRPRSLSVRERNSLLDELSGQAPKKDVI